MLTDIVENRRIMVVGSSYISYEEDSVKEFLTQLYKELGFELEGSEIYLVNKRIGYEDACKLTFSHPQMGKAVVRYFICNDDHGKVERLYLKISFREKEEVINLEETDRVFLFPMLQAGEKIISTMRSLYMGYGSS